MSGLSERRVGADRFHLDACFLTISAYAEDWHRLGLIFPNSLKTFLPVDSTPRRSWISRSALPRLLRGIARWISDRLSKPWFDRNKQRSRRPMRQVPCLQISFCLPTAQNKRRDRLTDTSGGR